MGEIIGAGLVAHAPTIMLPAETRYELNEGKEISLVPGLHRLKTEVLDVLKPDTIVLFDSHWFTIVEFCVAAHERRTGRYTSDELPRGMSQIPYDLKGSPALARAMADCATEAGVRTTAVDDPYLPIHYPTVNLSTYLHGGEEWVSVSHAYSGEPDDFLKVGEGIGQAIAQSDKRVVLIASGSMSHRFWPFKQIPLHEASDPIHISSPEAREADYERLRWFAEGNHAAVIDTMPDYLRHAPEARFGHYLMMAAACGGREWRARGRQFSDYENATGTSQVHVWFDKPDDGWN
ncbi:3,4-dihydroxyphenylacetate 2,3-dioxygenase [Novosphingobium piscinae]|uniref:Catechol 1,2-dioxygenase n=1 Tax=Novosphingobium piscinae TaxID=1507448 RepID=A0A7X1FYX5_9SPHN|nr:3,4-dihydroxyphenylacetate 2,3-dioxygenase [Novosphingobium piscinae]MBC2669559.1 catechol 1,2-dioxygenase [Novosphingobium piscinae]